MFSPDARLYLAYEQPDGQDGPTNQAVQQEWDPLVWKGYDGILSADGKSVIADFETVRWGGNDHLIAECAVRPFPHDSDQRWREKMGVARTRYRVTADTSL